MFQKACLLVLVGGVFSVVGPTRAVADEPVHVASTVGFEQSWMSHALPDQRRFVSVLSNQKRHVIFDVVPLNRYDDLMTTEQTDCVMSAFPAEFGNVVVAKNAIAFELKLFSRKGIPLNRLDVVEIGHLANIPKPPVPLSGQLRWHDVRSIEQGIELLDARRLDVLIADSTHVRMHENSQIVELNYPPVRIVELALVCRDTVPLREFVNGFDTAMAKDKFEGSIPRKATYDLVSAW